LKTISISIVSHGHDILIEKLLIQLDLYSSYISEVILTHNIPPTISPKEHEFSFKLKELKNQVPKGFGENHNAAYQNASGEYFCIMNPDVVLIKNPFHLLIQCLEEGRAELIAPSIINSRGELEDSARNFPTPLFILRKILFASKGITKPNGNNNPVFYSDWVAGMFILMHRNVFVRLKGFDQKFFLYYEDVDLCLRAWAMNFRVGLCSDAKVVHDGHRDSHKKMKFLKWHLHSLLRFWFKHLFRFPQRS